MILGLIVVAVGCSHQASSKEPAGPAGPELALDRVYEFNGQGRRLEYNRDPTKEIQWVETGPLRSSIHGEDLHGGGSTVESFDGGRVGLAHGTVLRLKDLALTRSLDGALELVEGS